MIYLDNAATTKPYDQVCDLVYNEMKNDYVNASAVYDYANHAKSVVDRARRDIAQTIGAIADEIYFTSCGSESDNWALKAVAEAYSNKGRHIITSKIEHHAILNTCQYLESRGFEITYLAVDKAGNVSSRDLLQAIRPDTILISIMMANNEIGTIEPIAELAKLAHERGILFHTDAVQAYDHIPIDVNELGVDLMSVSGHKFRGPKGVGFLYIKRQVKIGSFIHGGAQERQRRAGTVNVAGIAGMGLAAKMAHESLDLVRDETSKLRDYLACKILSTIDDVELNGPGLKDNRLANNLNVIFHGVRGESLLIMADREGIAISSGSACATGSLEPSHVLKAIGLSDDEAYSSIRLTVSELNTYEELDLAVSKLAKIVEDLRRIRRERL